MHSVIRASYRFMAAAGLGLLLAPAIALGACSRVINVPVSATGQSIIIEDEAIRGIYPDILYNLGLKEGCTFSLTAVPRARQELLFETGKADLLVPASKTPKRDAAGIFIPLVQNRATLISIDSGQAAIPTAKALLERPELKVVVVRGFDYGPAYQQLIQRLIAQGRVTLEVDALSVARLLKSGAADLTIMAPTILAGVMREDARVRDAVDKLRIEPLPELPWGVSGIYLSKRSLNPKDTAALRDMLEQAAQSGVVWRSFQRYYTPAVLQEGIRPR